MADRSSAAAPQPMAFPPETAVVPCPYCGETANHKGTCELSVMSTGKHYAVLAVPAVYAAAPGNPASEPVSAEPDYLARVDRELEHLGMLFASWCPHGFDSSRAHDYHWAGEFSASLERARAALASARGETT